MKTLLNDLEIEIKIIRKPNKNLYIRFSDNKTLLVTCNKWVSEKEILKIIEKNKTSLEKMLQKKEIEAEKEKFFQYLGHSYIKVFNEKVPNVTFDGKNIIAKNEKMLEKFYKKECERIFQSEVERITPFFQSIPSFTLKIRTMKTRWGVNNITNKSITLNSELLKKDLDLLDYVIIHELCHFYEANHSEKFWSRVSEYYPKYKEARKRLRG